MMRTILSTTIIGLILLFGSMPSTAQVVMVDKVYDYIKNNELEKAKEAIDIAVNNEITAKDARAWYVRSYVYMEIYKKSAGAEASKLRDEALKSAERAKSFDTSNKYASEIEKVKSFIFITYFNEAVKDFNEAKYKEAIVNFEKYIGFNKGSNETSYAEALYYNGYSYMFTSNSNQAIKYFEQAIAAGLENPAVFEQLALMYMESNQLSNAENTIAHARKKYPMDLNIRITEINFNLSLKKFEVAEKLVKEYLQIDPNNIEVLLVAGTVYGKVLENTPEDKEAYFIKRVDSYRKVLSLDPNNMLANFNLGITLHNKAADLIYQETQSPSDEDLVAFDRILTRSTSLFKEGLPYLLKAHSLEPKNPITLKAMENIYEYLNESEKLKEVRAKMLTLDKN
jgi:tetratricopeptide (TPR) repeat protein